LDKSNKNILISICARGGSKGICGKNIKVINGFPLIYYSINIAKKYLENTNGVIGLSTDSREIKNIADLYGVTTEYLRPDFLAIDNAGKIETIKHLLQYEEDKRQLRFDYVLDLDVSSPLRTVEDLKRAELILESNNEALNIFSVNKCHRNPYFNQVERGNDGYYHLVKEIDSPVLSRQSAPEVYDLNASFYFFRRNYFDMNYRNAYTEKSLIYLMEHICFDLDEPIDFELMEYLMINNKLNFKYY
jgi:CMP-N,N'-diacetyllegionaminic acid synthase